MNADSTLTVAEKRTRVAFVSLAFGLLSAIILSLVYLSASTTTAATATLSFTGGVSNIFLPCTLPLAFIIVPLSMAEGYRKGLTMAVLFGVGLTITLGFYGVAVALIGLYLGIDQATRIMYVLAGIAALLFGLSELKLVKCSEETIMLKQFLQRTFGVLVAVGLLFVGVAFAAETGRHLRVDDVDVYYGILPAQVAGKHDPTHEERTMHGGVPRGSKDSHLIVALFGKDGVRITDAQVSATVAELGMAGTRKKLEPMRIEDTISFGNYFAIYGSGPYLITLEIRLPGARRSTEAVFEYKAR